MVAGERGLDVPLLALGVAQAANAGSLLLPTANLTTLLALGPAPGGDGTYVRHVWVAWVLVAAATIAALTLLIARRPRSPRTIAGRWSPARIGGDLLAMFLLASSIRATIPAGLSLGTGFWPAAVGASALAAAANNLPAAAAVHATTPAATWGAVAGLAIGPNLLLTGSVATVIVRRLTREAGVHLSVWRFTLVGLTLVPIQLTAMYVGLRLTHAI